jgi:outer membrane receptor for monomeric catechols
VRDQFRYANYQRAGRITEPQVIYTGVTPNTPLAQIAVNRNLISVFSTESFLDNQSDVTVRFNTGPVAHTLVAGIELGRETSTPTRIRYAGVPTANLLTPNLSQPFAGIPSIQTQINTRSSSYSAYLVDTIEIGERWELIGGFRWDTFETSFKQYIAPALSLNRTDNMPSWRAAIVYKPQPNGSVYFAYGTSFNPSAETPPTPLTSHRRKTRRSSWAPNGWSTMAAKTATSAGEEAAPAASGGAAAERARAADRRARHAGRGTRASRIVCRSRCELAEPVAGASDAVQALSPRCPNAARTGGRPVAIQNDAEWRGALLPTCTLVGSCRAR